MPFPDGSAQLRRLGTLVSEHATATSRIRALEAERMRLLAAMADLAAAEIDRVRGVASADRRSAERDVGELAMRTVAAEVAFATGVSDRAVVNELGLAMRLAEDYGELVDELSRGRTSLAHVRAVADEGGIIADRAARRAYGGEMLELATTETPNRTRRLAKVVAAKHVPEPEERERAAARLRMRVEVIDLEHGLSELRAVLASVEAHAIKDRLTRQARSVQQRELAARRAAGRRATGRSADGRSSRESARHGATAPGAPAKSSPAHAVRAHDGATLTAAPSCDPDPPHLLPAVRPLDQIRASVLSDLLINAGPTNETGDTDLSGITARIQVTVPVLGLLPQDRRPKAETGIAGLQGAAVLAGCGPIDAETARFLASIETSWDAVFCDPATGEILATDRYRPTEGLRRFVFARDQHCRYPGCLIVPHRSDIDHARAASLGGPTSSDNLEVLCRYHHVLKHNTGISMEQLRGGELRWRSPLGVIVIDKPASRVMFRPVGVDPPEEDESPPPWATDTAGAQAA